ncbi:MAG: thermonuclease family protein [Candidatus Omnitrophica bacterium]|nr:thermonuclease family protein [Candidatus Omnitrophota bacterium]MDD5310314.1 thermonuclease family protein [Candidatus Omnitrophota bacterium]MDD5545859.1 thermonuclease family protein [Candidatus Omnitrophota bacterium]
MLSRVRPVAAIFFALAVSASLISTCGSAKAEAVKSVQAEELRVARVIDGDTVVLEDGRHVRYIGMDTPERRMPYYTEAKRENERLVRGKTVKLEYDVGRTDKYGRILAYVYAGDIFVNAELVKGGYAVIATYPPNVKYVDKFKALQEEARKEKRGLWGIKSGRGSVW